MFTPPSPSAPPVELMRVPSLFISLTSEFIASMLCVYVAISMVTGLHESEIVEPFRLLSTVGIAWAYGAMIFTVVFCTTAVSGGHINPVVTLVSFFQGGITRIRALAYIGAQLVGSVGALCLMKAPIRTIYNPILFTIVGGLILVYAVCNISRFRMLVLGPLPMGAAVIFVYLVALTVLYKKIDQFMLGATSMVIAAVAASYQHHVLRTIALRTLVSYQTRDGIWSNLC